MRTSKIIKQLAKKEGVSVEYIRVEIQKAIELADWNKVGNNGMKPNSIEDAITILQKEVHK